MYSILATSAKKPTIKDFFLTLEDSSNHKLIVDKALNKMKFWTKVTEWSNITLKASSHYKPELDSAGKPNYITHFVIGIEHMDISLALLRGKCLAKYSLVSCSVSLYHIHAFLFSRDIYY